LSIRRRFFFLPARPALAGGECALSLMAFVRGCSTAAWLDHSNQNRCPGKKPNMDKGSADPPDRKARLIVIIIALLTVTSAIGLTVAWFVLIGYGVLALVGWMAG